jgi:hypothetical protein
MQVDALALVLRPRSMVEASDLGVRMVQAQARALWRTVGPVYALVVLVAAASADLGSWAPTLVLFWLKPWIDHSLLFVLSRAAFGESSRFGDLWRAGRSVWLRGLLSTLTLQRLSPWRAYTLPVTQLEGQGAWARSARRRIILQGQRGHAVLVQFAFGTVELAVAFGLWSLVLWFAPPGERADALALLTRNSESVLLLVPYALTVLLVEPFFVAAGFAMYLNRRVQLEAWDLEQEFRHVFS